MIKNATPEDRKLAEKYFKAPFGEEMTGWIADKDHRHVADIRGWGYLTGQGACALSDEKAIRVQNAMTLVLVDALNEYYERHK